MLKINNNPSEIDFPICSFDTFFSKLKKLCQKICHAISSFFSQFSCFNPPNFRPFDQREIVLLRDYGRPSTALPAVLAAQNLIDKDIKLISSSSNTTNVSEPTKSKEPQYRIYDATLEEFRQFARDFTSLTVDIVEEKYLISATQSIQNTAPTLPSVIKSIAKLLIEMGDKAAKPLFQRFSQQKTSVIDPALQKIFNVLLKEDASSEIIESTPLYTCIEKRVLQEIKDPKLHNEQNLNTHYIFPILNWLLYSNHTTPIKDLFIPAENYQEDLIDQLLELAITALVERKIDYYTHQLQTHLQDRLDTIVHHTLQINSTRIVDFFTDRLSELITNMSFPQTFDKILKEVVAAQIKGFIAGQASLNKHKNFLNKAKANQANIIEAENAQELTTKVQADIHMASVALHGGEKAFLEHIFLEEFSKKDACNPQIQQIIQQEIELIKQGKEPQYIKKAGEKAIYMCIAERFISLMLPVRKKVCDDGTIEEIEPFTQLWNQLYIPPEFHQLNQHMEELFSEFLTPEVSELFSRIKEPIRDCIKNIFHATLQDLLKKQLFHVVQKAFEKIALPNQLDQLMAEDLLPAINRQLIKVFMDHELQENIQSAAPFFYQLLTDGKASYAVNKKNIADFLIHLTKEKFDQFNSSEFYAVESGEQDARQIIYQGLTEKDWNSITNALIEKTEQIILDSVAKPQNVNAPANQAATTSIKDVSDILTKSYQNTNAQNTPILGELAMNLLFDVGEFTNETIISYMLKDAISKALTEAVSPMRISYHYLSRSITENLKENLLDKPYVEELLFSRAQPPSPLLPQKLEHQINTTACIAHDFIMRLAEKKGTIAKFAAKRVLKDSPYQLNQLITTIYKKMFGYTALNQNLILNTIQELFSSFAKAATDIQNRENFLLHQNAIKIAKL